MIKKVLGISYGIICMCAVTVSAKTALYSDIDTYINHYPISGYAVDGKMVVVAEDLRDYRFNVIYNNDERALHITRNTDVTSLIRKDIYDPDYPSGTKFSDIYESDIKVDYNGIRLQSYAINGYTLIPINDLAALAGSETWISDMRAYKVWIDWIDICEYKPLEKRNINKIWNNFLTSKKYLYYIDNEYSSNLEYAITDLNADNKPELLIQSTIERPFYYTWTFTLKDSTIICVDETYGYGMFGYSSKLNAILVSPDFKPTWMTGNYPFYRLNNDKFEFIFSVGHDMGTNYYYDDYGNRTIPETEKEAYFSDQIFFEWNKIN